ncbi:MAG: hypothetical protein KatS3mg031_2406 [Chitinophagales bacterium]|nr:MAG: hypothetical protein KatS3mg031_2406 [Chitinophagales bacterium]
MLHFIYLLRLAPRFACQKNWNEETRHIVALHFEYLKNYCGEGTVILAGRTSLGSDDIFNQGIVMLELPSIEAARNFMDQDPAVREGVMIAQLFPFSIALMRQVAP